MSNINEREPLEEKSTNGVGQDQLLADLKLVVADAESLLKGVANQGGEKLEEVRAKVQESLRKIGARIGKTEQAVLVRTRQAAKATDEYVHKSPWQAAGIAGVTGLLLGLLLRHR